MAMELRHLRYFVAVAEEGHITRAAERLGMQQPPLSQQIKAMERELDVQLFRRKPRGVELTDAGRAFLNDARAILARLDHAFEATRRTARGEQGRICVGVARTSTYHPFVPQVIRAFRETYPLVFLTFVEARNSELMEHLQTERVDVAFVRLATGDPRELVVNTLLEEPMVLALPSGHALARRTRGADVPLKALANEVFIAGPGIGLRAAALAAIQTAGFALHIGQEAPTTTSALNLVAAGLGISLVPASMQRLRIDGVAYRRLKGGAQLTAPLNMVSRRGDPSAVVRHFLSLVRNAAKNFVGH
jgi:DNA-binding transcriptional LysR family regulator